MSRNYKFESPEAVYFVTFGVINWIDIFTRREYKNIIVDSFNYCILNKGLQIYAWVLMTNHIHLVVSTNEQPLPAIIRDLKKYTSKVLIKELLNNPQESRREWILWMLRSAGQNNPNNQTYQLWQQHNNPLEISLKGNRINRVFNYIHMNPVKEGIVERSEDYLYSSAKDFQGEKGLVNISML